MKHAHMHAEPDGIPWLNDPVMLHSSRQYECSLNETEQCEYQVGYWRFWYEADHRFALPTVAFFMVAIILFAIGNFLSTIVLSKSSLSRVSKRSIGITRYLTYRTFRVNGLNWNTAPLGILMLAGVGTIFFFAMSLGPRPYYWPNTREISFGNSPPIATRTGWMSLGCLPFIFATSPKSNLITALTGVSHEKLQVFHRWISYAMFVLALIHTFPFIIFRQWRGDLVYTWNTSVYWWTGVVALLAQAYLTFASMSPLRNLCYEWFKYTHFFAALLFILVFFFHCNFRLSSWDYFIAAAVIYTVCWLHSQIKTFFVNGISTARITTASNDFIRIEVPTKTSWKAGQHYFVRFLTLGVHSWTAHPFTACSLPQEGGSSELVFLVRPQGGFTKKLASYAKADDALTTRVILDGPYGGVDMQKLVRHQRSLFIAGGSGAGFLLPAIEMFLRRLDLAGNNTIDEKAGGFQGPTARVILATRDAATTSWFIREVNELLAKHPQPQAANSLHVEVYDTGHEESAIESKIAPSQTVPSKAPELKGADSDAIEAQPDTPDGSSDSSAAPPSARIQSFTNRPLLPAIVDDEATRSDVTSLGVFACGPLSMQNDLSNAVAKQQLGIVRDGSKEVYLHMEHFSWA